jgi:hypothetical protein
MKAGVFFAVVSLALLAACATTPAVTGVPGFGTVTGKEWRLAELRTTAGLAFSRDALDAEFASIYTLEFRDGMALGRGAPNTYRFPFEQGRDQGLGIKPGATTLMAPLREPEGLAEGEYFGYLGRVYRWNVSGGALELHTKSENGEDAVLVYRPPDL